MMVPEIDPKLDLVLERTVDVAPHLVWKAWTQPEHLKKWFCPEPWKTVACEIDLRPGGVFRTVMRSPEGQEFPNEGCYLEVIEGKKLVWTDALKPGYRPADAPVSGAGMMFTAMIVIEPAGRGTKYTALCLHKNEADRNTHDKMGFYEGWGTCLDQLVALAKSGGL